MLPYKKIYTRALVHKPWVFIVVPVLVCVLLSLGIGNLGFRSDYRIFFDDESPEVQAFEQFESTYNSKNDLIFIVHAQEGIFSRKDSQYPSIEAVLALTEASWDFPLVKRVDSVLNFQHVQAHADDVVIDHIHRPQDRLDELEILRMKSAVMSEPLLVDRLISPDEKTTGVVVDFNLDSENKDSEIEGIIQRSRALAMDIETRFPQVDVRISGSVPMDYAFVEASKYDLSILTPIMFGVIFFLILLLTQSLVAASITSMIILLCISASMGVAGLLGIPLSPPSMMAPNIILTLATADCIHIYVAYDKKLRDGCARNDAVLGALKSTALPVLITSVTTAIGFFSLIFSESPPFRHLGIITGVSAIIALLLSLTLLPALLLKTKVAARYRESWLSRLSMKILRFTLSHSNPVLIIGGGTALLLSIYASQNTLDDRYVDYFDDSFVFKQDSTFLQENLTGIYSIEYSLESNARDGVGEPDYLNDVEAFANWLRSNSDVYHVESLADIIKRINQAMNGDDVAYYKVPEHSAAQYLLLYEMSLPYGLDLRDRLTLDRSASRMTVVLRDLSTQQIKDFLARAEQWAELNLTHASVSKGTGKSVLFAHIGMRNIHAMLIGTIFALVLISCVLTLLLRSVKLGLLATIGNIFPALVSLGLWSLLVGTVGMAVAVIVAVTLGIVVDSTVHILWKYRQVVAQGNVSTEDALAQVFATSVPAILISGIVLSAGFLCLYFSGFQITSWMGLMTAVTIFVALLIDLILLPAIIIRTLSQRVEGVSDLKGYSDVENSAQ